MVNVMECSEIIPTKENLIQAIKENSLGRNESVAALARICCEMEQGAIALDSQWGDGKTFLVKQTILLLDAYNPHLLDCELTDEEKNTIKTFCGTDGATTLENTPVFSVYYDAWKYDCDIDPVISIVYEIARICKSEDMLKTEPKLKDLFGRIAQAFGKKDLFEALTKDDRVDFLAELKVIRKRDELISEFFKIVLPERGNRLVIFVDELDRCNPSFAVKMLERVKHFFSEEQVLFVFSINAEQLQHTIKKCYGDQFDSTKYLNRFFMLKCSLPTVDREKYAIKMNGRGTTWYDRLSYCFCERNNLSLRDISRYFACMKNICKRILNYDHAYGEIAGIQFLQRTILPVMVGLWLTDREKYNNLVDGIDGSPYFNIMLDSRIESCLNAFKIGFSETMESEVILSNIYDTVFGHTSPGKTWQRGNYYFESNMKNQLLNTMSQLQI